MDYDLSRTATVAVVVQDCSEVPFFCAESTLPPDATCPQLPGLAYKWGRPTLTRRRKERVSLRHPAEAAVPLPFCQPCNILVSG